MPPYRLTRVYSLDYQPVSRERRMSGLAVASLLIGVVGGPLSLGLLTLGLLFASPVVSPDLAMMMVLLSPEIVAAVLGIIALLTIRGGYREVGAELAYGGLAFAALWTSMIAGLYVHYRNFDFGLGL